MYNSDPSSAIAAGGIIGLIMGMLALVVIVGIAVYVVGSLAYYNIFKKANVENPWLAWVPIGYLIPFFDTIKVSRSNIWFVVGSLVAEFFVALSNSTALAVLFGLYNIAVAVLQIVWWVKLLKVFGVSPLWLLLLIGLIIPFLNFFVLIAMGVLFLVFAFNKDIQYQG